MTPVMQARTEGFLANLAQRGVLLRLDRSGETFQALVGVAQADPMEHSLGEPESLGDRVHVLRPDCPQGVHVGDVFVDDENKHVHRVIKVDDRPTRIDIVFEVESAKEAE